GAESRQSVRLPPIVIQDESAWRQRPQDSVMSTAHSSAATRWRDLEGRALEVVAETPGDFSVIGIALRNMNTRFSTSGQILHDGAAVPGTLLVTGPGTTVKGIYRGPYDEIHLHVPNEVVAECSRELGRQDDNGLCNGAMVMRDAVVERLARSVLEADEVGSSL